jgi:thymidylate synthase (FAD)
MAKFERVEDKWKHLRKDLYGNVEPKVKLEAITMPLYPCTDLEGNPKEEPEFQYDHTCYDNIYGIHFKAIEQLPAIAAGVSYGSKEKMENDSERAIKLNKKLISQGHLTPFESVQLNFFVSGISKICGAQISRHRVGQGHVSASRRFQTAEPRFVYPTLDYIDDEGEASSYLSRLSQIYSESYQYYYKWFRDMGLHKEDSRLCLPISYATERTWWINVRALRDFFRLRLAADSEWEIRRLAWMMYDLVCPLMPSLFEDILEEKITISLDEYRLLKENK